MSTLQVLKFSAERSADLHALFGDDAVSGDVRRVLRRRARSHRRYAVRRFRRATRSDNGGRDESSDEGVFSAGLDGILDVDGEGEGGGGSTLSRRSRRRSGTRLRSELASREERDSGVAPRSATSVWHAKVSYFMYRYILRESCSQFDSLPLTSLTIFLTRPCFAREAHGDGRALGRADRAAPQRARREKRAAPRLRATARSRRRSSPQCRAPSTTTLEQAQRRRRCVGPSARPRCRSALCATGAALRCGPRCITRALLHRVVRRE